MKQKRDKIPRLEYEALVKSCFDQLKDRTPTIGHIRMAAESIEQLSSTRLYQFVIEDTWQYTEIIKWQVKLKNMIAKSVIIKIAEYNHIVLPRHYQISAVQADLIEEPTSRAQVPIHVALNKHVHTGGSDRLSSRTSPELDIPLHRREIDMIQDQLCRTNHAVLEAHIANLWAREHVKPTKPCTTTGKQLDNPAKLTATEKPMRDFTITKPIMVGAINILTADEATLAVLIRDAQEQIKANEDLAQVSTKYQKKNKQLEAVITLLVKQLDKA